MLGTVITLGQFHYNGLTVIEENMTLPHLKNNDQVNKRWLPLVYDIIR